MEVTLEQRLEDTGEQARQISGRSMLQAKGASGAKVLGTF